MYDDDNEEYLIYLENWISNLDYEINYWAHSLYRLHKHIGKDHTSVEVENNFKYPELLNKFEYNDVTVLDVGSGPYSWIGTKSNIANIRLYACDPLAYAYQTIHTKYHVSPEVIPDFAISELLSKTYGENKFDIICMNNALDHTFNPVIAVKEMLRVVKIGGVVRLEHRVNEAEYEKYEGLHKWNISGENSQLIIWNKSVKTNMNELLANCSKITTNNKIDEHGVCYVTHIIEKITEIPAYENKEDAVFYEALFRMLLLNNSHFLCSNVIKQNKDVKYSRYVKHKYWVDKLYNTPVWWLKRVILANDLVYNILVNKIRRHTRGKQ